MPKKSSRRVKNRQKRPDVLHQDMQSLLELQKTQSIRFVPEEKDVPRIRFAQNTLFNVELSYMNTISTSSTTPTFGGLAFQLNNVSNYANFTACFDRYRIINVSVKFIQNTSPVGAGTLYTVIDYDDSNAPSSIASLLNFATLKLTPPGVIDERVLTARTAVAAYSGTFTSYANMSSRTWLDSASPAIQYFGLKYAIPTTSVSYAITYVVTLAVQFKSQRAT